MVQTVPFLLVRALQTGRAADVKRVFSMRQGLALLDYQDPSSDDIKRLMLRTMFCPSFLRVSEGRRFLAFLFTLDVRHVVVFGELLHVCVVYSLSLYVQVKQPLLVYTLRIVLDIISHTPNNAQHRQKNNTCQLQVAFVVELVAVIRNQVPGGRRTVLEAYGDVLFRGWRDASGTPCAYAVEHDAIQDLMTAAIHAAAPDMAANLRAVLNGLHRQKACTGVDAMLCRLYEPILLRACTAPNAAVRTNALALLADAFPLNDPEVGERL